MPMDPSPLINIPTDFNIITFVREGGGYCAVLELLGIAFLLKDRVRMLETIKQKDAEMRELSTTCITVMTELKTFLFSERKA